MSGITWAMDLSPLLKDDSVSLEEFTLGYIDRLKADVIRRLRALG